MNQVQMEPLTRGSLIGKDTKSYPTLFKADAEGILVCLSNLSIQNPQAFYIFGPDDYVKYMKRHTLLLHSDLRNPKCI